MCLFAVLYASIHRGMVTIANVRRDYDALNNVCCRQCRVGSISSLDKLLDLQFETEVTREESATFLKRKAAHDRRGKVESRLDSPRPLSLVQCFSPSAVTKTNDRLISITNLHMAKCASAQARDRSSPFSIPALVLQSSQSNWNGVVGITLTLVMVTSSITALRCLPCRSCQAKVVFPPRDSTGYCSLR
jgi:hypothetical protein